MARKRKRKPRNRPALPPTPAQDGGQGGPEFIKPGPGQTSDTRILAKAIDQRWPIKAEYRAAVVNRMTKIVASAESSNREATAAAKALIAADAQNQADEIAAKPQQVQHAHVHAFLDAAIEQEIERITGKPATAQLEGLDGEGQG